MILQELPGTIFAILLSVEILISPQIYIIMLHFTEMIASHHCLNKLMIIALNRNRIKYDHSQAQMIISYGLFVILLTLLYLWNLIIYDIWCDMTRHDTAHGTTRHHTIWYNFSLDNNMHSKNVSFWPILWAVFISDNRQWIRFEILPLATRWDNRQYQIVYKIYMAYPCCTLTGLTPLTPWWF